jgi:hypothetical protein
MSTLTDRIRLAQRDAGEAAVVDSLHAMGLTNHTASSPVGKVEGVSVAEQIVCDILSDLTGRGGLRQSWDDIDADIQLEIKQKWVQLTRDTLKGVAC